MTNYKKIRRVIFYVLALILGYLAIILVHGYFADWQPGPEPVAIEIQGGATEKVIADSNLTFISWNVGYGGLGAESDFFYDDEGILYASRSMVRSPKELVEKNVNGAVTFLKNSKVDFFLLQEVDLNSDRSYNIPQYDAYREAIPGYSATAALNYKCSRVPIPLLQPWKAYGKALSGLGTFSRFQPSEAQRYQLPGHYPMPDRIFQLDRCVALERFPCAWGNELVVINVHNSAYDPGDKIKALQLPYLREIALKEYEKGNYVVMGGDWNQCPPNFRYDVFVPKAAAGFTQGNIPLDFFPEDWTYAYDPTVSTNRKAKDPYEKGKTFETLIDFYIVSPNIQILKVKGMENGYTFSDHQPVYLEITLK